MSLICTFQLSSGSDYTFSTTSFTPSADQTTQITDLIEGGSRTTPKQTTTVPTTTASSTDFPCHPDVAFVVDTSADVPSQEEYERVSYFYSKIYCYLQQLSFIADQLSPTLYISPLAVETEIIVYSTTYGGFIGANDYNYRSWQNFSEVVHEYDYFWNKFTQPSISGQALF